MKSTDPRLIQKTYYRPIEAAIRWSELMDEEEVILDRVESLHSTTALLSEWPTVYLHNERIYDGIINGELTCSKNGVKTADITADDPELTVRHIDLRRWIARYYPDDKPSFLFNENEKSAIEWLSAPALQFLMANHHLLKESVSHQTQTIKDLEKKLNAPSEDLKERSERTYLSIIGGMLDILVNNKVRMIPNQESIIDALVTYFPGHPGLSERTLRSKFSAAKRVIASGPS